MKKMILLLGGILVAFPGLQAIATEARPKARAAERDGEIVSQLARRTSERDERGLAC